MSNLFKNLFGKPADLGAIYSKGAIILDVRTPREFKSGHIEGAVNIPIDNLKSSLEDLKKRGKPVITCCLSGARSRVALNQLTEAGIEAYNGGSWTSLQRSIR